MNCFKCNKRNGNLTKLLSSSVKFLCKSLILGKKLLKELKELNIYL